MCKLSTNIRRINHYFLRTNVRIFAKCLMSSAIFYNLRMSKKIRISFVSAIGMECTRVEVLIIIGSVLLTFPVKFQNFQTTFEFKMFREFLINRTFQLFPYTLEGCVFNGYIFLFSLKLNIFTMLKNKSIVSTEPTRQKSVMPAILLCPAWNF